MTCLILRSAALPAVRQWLKFSFSFPLVVSHIPRYLNFWTLLMLSWCSLMNCAGGLRLHLLGGAITIIRSSCNWAPWLHSWMPVHKHGMLFWGRCTQPHTMPYHLQTPMCLQWHPQAVTLTLPLASNRPARPPYIRLSKTQSGTRSVAEWSSQSREEQWEQDWWDDAALLQTSCCGHPLAGDIIWPSQLCVVVQALDLVYQPFRKAKVWHSLPDQAPWCQIVGSPYIKECYIGCLALCHVHIHCLFQYCNLVYQPTPSSEPPPATHQWPALLILQASAASIWHATSPALLEGWLVGRRWRQQRIFQVLRRVTSSARFQLVGVVSVFQHFWNRAWR